MKAKDVPELESLTETLADPWKAAFRRLPELYGGPEILSDARRVLPGLPGVVEALDELAALLALRHDIQLAVDLGDLRGFGYHNGAVFAAYTGGQAQAVALGGRYDGAGAIFGRARPATGFSLDLRRILNVLPEPAPRLQEGVLGQVVGQRLVPAGQVAEETPDGGLVAEHQFAEGIPVALEGAGDQRGVGQGHDCGGREPSEGLLRKL